MLPNRPILAPAQLWCVILVVNPNCCLTAIYLLVLAPQNWGTITGLFQVLVLEVVLNDHGFNQNSKTDLFKGCVLFNIKVHGKNLKSKKRVILNNLFSLLF